MPQATEFPDENAASIGAWSRNAAYWDAAQGNKGNFWQREIVFPATRELLEPLAGRILEIACGNGNFARMLAASGVQVTATDASPEMLRIARRRSLHAEPPISWQLADATSADQLGAITGGPFGAAVCNMALMDIAELGPLFQTLPQLLEPCAPLVFSVLHPAFHQGPITVLFSERREIDADGRFEQRQGVSVSRYLSAFSAETVAILGQPVRQPHFHRPLEALLGAAFEHGWALDGLREPAFPRSGDTTDPKPYRLRWDDLAEIPPVLVARLRPVP